MIIILEGPDNAGKSTLGQRLSADLQMDVVHPGGPPKNIADVIARCNEQAVTFTMSAVVDFIYDRVTCISDMIYRGKPQYDEMFGSFHNQITFTKNVVIIYCRPSDERVYNFDDHIQKDHEDEAIVQFAKDNVDRIVKGYDSFMDWACKQTYLYVVRYNFENELSYEPLLALLKSMKDIK